MVSAAGKVVNDRASSPALIDTGGRHAKTRRAKARALDRAGDGNSSRAIGSVEAEGSDGQELPCR